MPGAVIGAVRAMVIGSADMTEASAAAIDPVQVSCEEETLAVGVRAIAAGAKVVADAPAVAAGISGCPLIPCCAPRAVIPNRKPPQCPPPRGDAAR